MSLYIVFCDCLRTQFNVLPNSVPPLGRTAVLRLEAHEVPVAKDMGCLLATGTACPFEQNILFTFLSSRTNERDIHYWCCVSRVSMHPGSSEYVRLKSVQGTTSRTGHLCRLLRNKKASVKYGQHQLEGPTLRRSSYSVIFSRTKLMTLSL